MKKSKCIKLIISAILWVLSIISVLAQTSTPTPTYNTKNVCNYYEVEGFIVPDSLEFFSAIVEQNLIEITEHYSNKVITFETTSFNTDKDTDIYSAVINNELFFFKVVYKNNLLFIYEYNSSRYDSFNYDDYYYVIDTKNETVFKDFILDRKTEQK